MIPVEKIINVQFIKKIDFIDCNKNVLAKNKMIYQ